MNQSVLKAGFTAGVVVGVLDAIAASVNAFLQRGVSPVGVFRYVASGALGKKAFEGGVDIAALGLLFHFIIAIAWTMLFFVAYQNIRLLRMNKTYVGLGYGIFVWLGMNLVVLPLSNVPPLTYKLTPTLSMIGIHMFIIGLSISFFANRYFSKQVQAL